MLTGSVSLGWSTKDSDIDLMAFINDIDTPPDDKFHVRDIDIFVEYYNQQTCLDKFKSNNLDFAELRIAGRIANSRCLYQTENSGYNLINAASRAKLGYEHVLNALNTSRMFLNEAKSHVDNKNITELALRDASNIMGTLWLCFSKCKFQKPKWFVNSLQKYAPNFVDVFLDIHNLKIANKNDGSSTLKIADEILTTSEKKLLEANEHHLTRSQRRRMWLAKETLREANGLLASNLYNASIYTARFAVQLVLITILSQGMEVSGLSGILKSLVKVEEFKELNNKYTFLMNLRESINQKLISQLESELNSLNNKTNKEYEK